MALKKRAKASAEFNMSSLTDIIFLLLIFFMLTSGLVAPNALSLKLPGSSSTLPDMSKNNMDEVAITVDGSYSFNGKKMDLERIAEMLKRRAFPNPKEYNFGIAPEKETPVEHVVSIMEIALQLDINGVLMAEE
jgi:biopolymer transport protein ExbD